LLEFNQLDSVVSVVGEDYRKDFSRRLNITASLCTGDVYNYLRLSSLYGEKLRTLSDTILNKMIYSDQDVVNGLVYSNAAMAAGILIELYDSKDDFHCAWQNCE
jgi:hypothetical protein